MAGDLDPGMDDEATLRYLQAKKTVDDRALHAGIYARLHQLLHDHPRPVQVLELGAGSGAMIDRLLERGTLTHAVYTAVDRDRALSQAALAQAGYWRALAPLVTVKWEVADVYDFVALAQGQHQWDLLLAHAFLDLVDVPTLLPQALRLVRPGGLCYFTINFDGGTILEPPVDVALDAEIIRAYHEDMDRRQVDGRPAGDSQTGRHLFAALRAARVEILAAGSSDWTVYADGQGRYPADEAVFLRLIVETIAGAVAGQGGVEPGRLAAWTDARLAQIQAGELIYIAHQLDFLGRLPEETPAMTSGAVQTEVRE